MQFNPLLTENNYHDLQPLKKDDVMTRIKEQLEQEDPDGKI